MLINTNIYIYIDIFKEITAQLAVGPTLIKRSQYSQQLAEAWLKNHKIVSRWPNPVKKKKKLQCSADLLKVFFARSEFIFTKFCTELCAEIVFKTYRI